MCDDHDETYAAHHQKSEQHLWVPGTDVPAGALPSPVAPVGRRQPLHLPRRAVLGGMASLVSAPLWLRDGPATAAVGGRSTGQSSLLAAMHVHGSFSEEEGSWQGQAWRMQQEAVDLMFMTDHSHGQLTMHMAADLTGVDLVTRRSGAAAVSIASIGRSGDLTLAVRSAGSAPSSSAVVIDPDSKANRLAIRTSIMGQALLHTFGQVSVGPGGVYEVRVGLSHHPATAGRPAGLYGLCFRFGPRLSPSADLEDHGLTGVVTAPLPRSGSQVRLDLAATAAQAWPDLLTEDNGLQWASFTVVSPDSSTTAAVDVDSVVFDRASRTPAQVARVQSAMAARYSADYGLAIVPAAELGRSNHHNAFTRQQYFAADEELAYTNPRAYTQRNVAAVHAAGGLVSWNHPFGATTGTPATGPTAVRRRQATYQALAKENVYGVDILEVGYAVRGGMGIDDHLGLWDTFSRHGRFLTGNGVSDSHDSSNDRRRMANEFVTGIWCRTTGLTDVLPALAAGRAWTRHVSSWGAGELDLVVDGAFLMGQVVVGSARNRTLTLTATNLPAGSVVQVVAGPVDYQGIDPGTQVIGQVGASAFDRNGMLNYPVAVPGSCFVRLTVRDAKGTVIGVGNPVWLLTAPPPGGVPAARQPR